MKVYDPNNQKSAFLKIDLFPRWSVAIRPVIHRFSKL